MSLTDDLFKDLGKPKGIVDTMFEGLEPPEITGEGISLKIGGSPSFQFDTPETMISEATPTDPDAPSWGEVLWGGTKAGALSVPAMVGSFTRFVGEVIHEEGEPVGLAKWGEVASKYWRGLAQEAAPQFKGKFYENPSWKRAAGAVTQAMPSLAVAVGASVATGSPVGGAAVLSTLEASSLFEEAREAGVGVGKATTFGAAAGVGIFFLEKIGLASILKGGSSKLTHILVSGVTEGTTESAQEVLQNTIAKYGYEPTRSFWDGTIESFIGGAGAGGAMSGVIHSTLDTGDQDRLTEVVSKVVESESLDVIATNASGESAASLEALSVGAQRKAKGIRHFIVDSRSGIARPTIGPRPEDNVLNPHDILIQVQDDSYEVVNKGESATEKPGVLDRAVEKITTPLLPEQLEVREEAKKEIATTTFDEPITKAGGLPAIDLSKIADPKVRGKIDIAQRYSIAAVSLLKKGTEGMLTQGIPDHLARIEQYYKRTTQADYLAKELHNSLVDIVGKDRARVVLGSIEGELAELNETETALRDVMRNFFTQFGDVAKDRGLLSNVIDEYVTRMWEKPGDAERIANKYLASGMETRSPFMMQRRLNSIVEGEALGLKIVTDPGVIMATYVRSMLRAYASKEFGETLLSTQIMKPDGVVDDLFKVKTDDPDYIPSSSVLKNVPRIFRRMTFLGSDGTTVFLGSQDLMMHKSAALDFSTLSSSSNEWMSDVTRKMKKGFFTTKQTAKMTIMHNPAVHGLNAGFNLVTSFDPRFPIKTSPAAIWKRGVEAEKDPELMMELIGFGLNPEGAQNVLKTLQETVSIERELGMKFMKGPFGLLERFNHWTMWQNLRRAQIGIMLHERDLKWKTRNKKGNLIVDPETGKKRPMDWGEVNRIAADEVNTRMGQLPSHWKTRGEKWFTHWFLLAANWTPSNARQLILGIPAVIRDNLPGLKQIKNINIFQQKYLPPNIRPQSRKMYTKFIYKSVIYSTMIAGVWQYLATGTFPWENDEGHRQDIWMGEYGPRGEKVYSANPAGRSTRDMQHFANPQNWTRIATNKADPIIKMLLEAFFNRDLYTNEEIEDPGAPPIDKVGAVAMHLATTFFPARSYYGWLGFDPERSKALNPQEKWFWLYGSWARYGPAASVQVFNMLSPADKKLFKIKLGDEWLAFKKQMETSGFLTSKMATTLYDFTSKRRYLNKKINGKIEILLGRSVLEDNKGNAEKARDLRGTAMELARAHNITATGLFEKYMTGE